MNIMLAYKNKMESRKQHFQNDRNSQSGLASNKIPQKSKKSVHKRHNLYSVIMYNGGSCISMS